jgi:aryl-alcohol dehydrogenase-like predicted oxidoreductase
MDVIAQAHGASVSQVALAWMLANPLISSPIIGPNKMEQLADNLGALDVALAEEELQTLNKVTAWQEPD